MKRISGCASNRVVAAAILVGLALAAATAHAQSPLFPTTNPVYNNPYGAPSSNPNGVFYRGVQFPLKPLPAVYSQPLPSPSPSVMAQVGSKPYNYGANSNIHVFGDPNVRAFGNTHNYEPTRYPNWAPNFSSR
jgi:hypothetical protein